MRTLIGVEQLAELLLRSTKSWVRKRVKIPPAMAAEEAEARWQLLETIVRPAAEELARDILTVSCAANRSYSIVPSGEDDGSEYILCLVCGLISANPNDVEHRYCGNCHLFHEDEKFVAPVV